MIISEKKPEEEILQILDGANNIILIGCAECATVCRTGGEPELAEMKDFLEANGKKVLGTVYASTSCNKLLAKKELKAVKEEMKQADAILSLACGDGVQTVASLVGMPVYPANNTMFLGEVERVGHYVEACRFCGDCVLAYTGAICPVTKCAKSLVTGPCGGAKDGMCEVNSENACAWIMIYNKLGELNQLDKLYAMTEPKDYAKYTYPRVINLKGGEQNE